MKRNMKDRAVLLKKAIKILLFISLGLQLVVLSQMYFFRPDLLMDATSLFLRLVRGVAFSFLAGAVLLYPSYHLIRFLNRRLPWRGNIYKRFIIQFFITVVAGLIITPPILFLAAQLTDINIDTQTVVNNAYYMVILALFLMVVLEARIYADESAQARIEAEEWHQQMLTEAAQRAQYEARVLMEEEKNAYARQMIEKEQALNKSLEIEIRERERLARELDESRAQLQGILANLEGAAYRCLFDENFTMKFISGKIAEITGYPPSDFIDNAIRSFSSVIFPEDIGLSRSVISEAARNKTSYEYEYRLIHKDGRIIYVYESGKCLYNELDEVSFLDGIILDISRRKEAEIAAKESERRFRELMDFLPQPVFELNLEGEITLTNRAGDAFFGALPAGPDQKTKALDCFIEEDRPRIIENFKKSSHGILTEPGEFTAIKGDGSLCPVMVFGTPILRDGKIIGRRGIIIDISERKKYEMNLLKANEALEQINNRLEQSVAERTNELTKANTQLLKVQKENLQSQFEVLKQQVNPHFLFNSLNVLTSLIKIDPDLAESFTERLSKVYRYVLENKEKDVVPLSTELEFLHSYMFLLEIRFMNKIQVQNNIQKSYYDYQVLPIAIQLLIENAIKHNTFSKSQPLKIDIFVDEEGMLNIVNNLNIRETKPVSTGVGLENITRRYALISEYRPQFSQTATHFIAKLPLLKPD